MTEQNLPQTQGPRTLEIILGSQNIRKRFDDILGKKAAGFISSIISAVNQNPSLKKVDPMTVVSAAAVAASLDLPINPSLGFAYIVPYKDRAQFQMGWRGYVQLAQRSGQYRTINVAIVREGELKRYDKFTGEMEFDEKLKTSDKVIGYVAYFRLLNGFEKYYYMSLEEVREHGKRYSRSFDNKDSRWQQDFDAMALKTVIKLILNRWAPLSIDIQTAIRADQAIVKESGDYEYPDNSDDNPEEDRLDTSEFDKKIADIEVDQNKLNEFLSAIAKTNKSTIEKVKIEAANRFEEFWQAFCKWAKISPPEKDKKRDKVKMIVCPNTQQTVDTEHCENCTNKNGCPAIE